LPRNFHTKNKTTAELLLHTGTLNR